MEAKYDLCVCGHIRDHHQYYLTYSFRNINKYILFKRIKSEKSVLTIKLENLL